MNTDRFEEFIKANRDAFDDLEPSPGVWEKIKKESQKTKKLPLKKLFYRVAGAVAAVAVIAVLLYTGNIINSPGYMAMADDPELKELLEVESYYAKEVDSKLTEIEKCDYASPELKTEVESDLNELEQMYFELKNDLKENISNKQVIEAMIENNRYRLKLVDDVLDQINC